MDDLLTRCRDGQIRARRQLGDMLLARLLDELGREIERLRAQSSGVNAVAVRAYMDANGISLLKWQDQKLSELE